LNREDREGFLFESGTPADRALAGVAIRAKCSYYQRDVTAASGYRSSDITPYIKLQRGEDMEWIRFLIFIFI